MDSKQLAEYLDQSKWLINNGLINDGIKNQLFTFGSVVHKDLKALELDIKVETKELEYRLFFDEKTLKLIAKYEELSKSDSMWGLWRFKRMLKKHGNLNIHHILSKFVRDFCGPKWIVKVNLMDFKNYVEGNVGGAESDPPGDKQVN